MRTPKYGRREWTSGILVGLFARLSAQARRGFVNVKRAVLVLITAGAASQASWSAALAQTVPGSTGLGDSDIRASELSRSAPEIHVSFAQAYRNPDLSTPGTNPYQSFLGPPSVYRISPDVPPSTGPISPRDLPPVEASSTAATAVAVAGRPLTLSEVSWTYRAPTPPRVLKRHDIIVVIVDEKTQVISEGELDRRKTANAAWTLKDWVLLRGFSLIPDPQSRGDPKISGQVEQRFRAEGDFQSRGAMKFRIACEVVDIRPNGTLVLEGRRWLRNNDEIWEISLLGVVRPEDVLPNNTVLSENVANLRVYKREIGQVRDGYRRGWFTRLFDDYQPF